MTFPSLPFRRPLGVLAASFLCAVILSAAPESRNFDIPAGPAEQALKLFTVQSGMDVLFGPATAAAARTNEVKGAFPPRAALDRLLDGSGLIATANEKTGAMTISRDPNGQGTAQKTGDRPHSRSGDIEGGAIRLETFEVMGTKLLNMDVKRTRDDAQPYVILGRTAIEESGAVDLDTFLKQRLTMNTTGRSAGQSANFTGNVSTINLRGLGANQTLILVDGHRLGTGNSLGGVPSQADLNGIPLSAIERIEVLSTTASGIYGGTATGGVVNVILRRDYTGVEFRTTYANSFDTDAANLRFDLSAAYTSETGKTNLLFAASWNDQHTLTARDRDFVAEGRQRSFANNPAVYLAATNPPLSLTPNIRSSDNSNLVLKTGQALGSNITFVPYGYAGIGTDGGAALVGNAGRYNLTMTNAAVSNTGLPYIGSAAAIISAPRVSSASFTVRSQLTSRLQAFIDLGASENLGRFPTVQSGFFYTIPASSVANPFNQAIVVSVPTSSLDTIFSSTTQTYRLTAGAIAQLAKDWKVEADYAWVGYRLRYVNANPLTAAASASVTSGAVIVLRDTTLFPVDLSPFKNPPAGGKQEVGQDDFTLRLSGPLGSLPGGIPTLSALLEHLEQSYTGYRTFSLSPTYSLPTSQTVLSAYAEVKLPFISAVNRKPGIEELEVQLAGRTDSYTIHGGTASISFAAPVPEVRTTNKTRSTNPTLAVRYKPVPDLMFRGSYGTGFVPPAVSQLTPGAPLATNGGTNDPLRGNQPLGSFLRTSGGNPTLHPEKSVSWSAGLVYSPKRLPEFRFSLDWTKISKTENIFTPTIPQLIANESSFPGRVTRGSSLPGDLPGWAGPVTAVDITAVNIARAEVEAFDAQVDYQWRTTNWGSIAFFAAATYQPHYKTQILPTSPLVENAGVTSNNPLKIKGNLGITWTHNAWTAGWVGRYSDSYLVADPSLTTSASTFLSQGSRTVPSQFYHDVFAKYRFGGGSALVNSWKGVLARIELQVGVRNVLNKIPPYDAGNGSYSYSYYGEPQLATYYLSLRKQF